MTPVRVEPTVKWFAVERHVGKANWHKQEFAGQSVDRLIPCPVNRVKFSKFPIAAPPVCPRRPSRDLLNALNRPRPLKICSRAAHFFGWPDPEPLATCQPSIGRHSIHGELLNAVVVGVHDEEVSSAVQGESVWGIEFAGVTADPKPLGDFSGGELLDAAADRAHPDPVVLIDTRLRAEGRLRSLNPLNMPPKFPGDPHCFRSARISSGVNFEPAPEASVV